MSSHIPTWTTPNFSAGAPDNPLQCPMLVPSAARMKETPQMPSNQMYAWIPPSRQADPSLFSSDGSGIPPRGIPGILESGKTSYVIVAGKGFGNLQAGVESDCQIDCDQVQRPRAISSDEAVAFEDICECRRFMPSYLLQPKLLSKHASDHKQNQGIKEDRIHRHRIRAAEEIVKKRREAVRLARIELSRAQRQLQRAQDSV